MRAIAAILRSGASLFHKVSLPAYAQDKIFISFIFITNALFILRFWFGHAFRNADKLALWTAAGCALLSIVFKKKNWRVFLLIALASYSYRRLFHINPGYVFLSVLIYCLFEGRLIQGLKNLKPQYFAPSKTTSRHVILKKLGRAGLVLGLPPLFALTNYWGLRPALFMSLAVCYYLGAESAPRRPRVLLRGLILKHLGLIGVFLCLPPLFRLINHPGEGIVIIPALVLSLAIYYHLVTERAGQRSLLLILGLSAVCLGVGTWFGSLNHANEFFWPGTTKIYQSAVDSINTPAPGLLSGYYFALTAAAAFLLFRLVLRDGWALLPTLVYMSSAVHIGYIVPVQLADYPKAPAMLLLAYFMLKAVARPLAQRRFWVTGVLLGLVTASVLIIRNDMLLFYPLIAFILLFVPRCSVKKGLPALRLCALAAVFIFYFWARLFYPTEAVTNSNRTTYGFNPEFAERLGLAPSPLVFGLGASDVSNMTHNAAVYALHGSSHNYGRQNGFTVAPDSLNDQYSPTPSFVVLKMLMMKAPADVYRQLAETVKKIFQFAFKFHWPSVSIESEKVRSLIIAREQVLERLHGFTFIIIVLGLAALSLFNMRFALSLLFMMMYIFSYYMLRYEARHYFFWEIFPLFFIASLLAGLSRFTKFSIASPFIFNRRAVIDKKAVARTAFLALILSAAPLVNSAILDILGKYQQYSALSGLEDILSRDRLAIPFSKSGRRENGRLDVYSIEIPKGLPDRSLYSAYMLVEINAPYQPEVSEPFIVSVKHRTDPDDIYPKTSLRGRYKYEPGSRTFKIHRGHDEGENIYLLFPLSFYGPIGIYGEYATVYTSKKLELELRSDSKSTLRGLYYLDNKKPFPFVFSAALTDDWRNRRFYPAVRETAGFDAGREYLKPLPLEADMIYESVEQNSNSLKFHGYLPVASYWNFPEGKAITFKVRDSCDIDMRALTKELDLFISEPLELKKDEDLVVGSNIKRGSLRLALLEDGLAVDWIFMHEDEGPNRRHILPVPRDGRYSLGLATFTSVYDPPDMIFSLDFYTAPTDCPRPALVCPSPRTGSN